MCSQDFAEKPQGDALRAMQVDTTKLGLDAERWDWVLPFLACTAACLPQCWPIQLAAVFSPGLHNWLSPAVSACTAGHFLPFLGAASHLMLHLLCISGGWLAWCYHAIFCTGQVESCLPLVRLLPLCPHRHSD